MKLFFDAARRLGTAHGHAGFAVNLSPTSVNQNESTEYLISRMLPGLDVGVPSDLATRQLKGKIKTVDWLTAIDQSMLDAVGGLSRLRSELPQEWFAIGDYGYGIVVRAGVIPDSGTSESTVNRPLYHLPILCSITHCA
ncbi:type VI immunity family protein [Burkholderia cepacia]|uniref:type VI immunity family protein n=1 Tax=Burkholderia cepacia TaxID=292 RepID=UPI001FC7F529|nr:type VI immunity family protein [Burkholderia cepacia]